MFRIPNLPSFILCLALTAFAGTTILAQEQKPAPNERPNIVLMMSDDQGWGEVAYYGHPYLKTPVLDEMAKTGLRMDRFYASAPVCTPTRASLLTGRNHNRSGSFYWDWSLRPEEITIAQILKDNGYRTAHFGKWHVGAVKKDSPLNPKAMGFDEFISHDNFFETDPELSRNGEAPVVFKGEGSEVVIDEALKFAHKSQKEGKPFFIVIWFGSPHVPYVASEEEKAPYKELGDQIAGRFAEITAMDRAIGKFRDELGQMGVRDNTLLWFNSDNGIARVGIPEDQMKYLWNGDLRGSKGDLTEGGIRVPAIIEWPAVIKTQHISLDRLDTTDILPTLLDVTGIAHPKPDRPLDGVSLKPLIMGQPMPDRSLAFWIYDSEPERANQPWISDPEKNKVTVLTARQKLAQEENRYEPRYFVNHQHPVEKTGPLLGEAAYIGPQWKLLMVDNGTKAQLYDLAKDPGEKNDVAGQHQPIVEKMLKELRAWQQSVEHSLTGADYKD